MFAQTDLSTTVKSATCKFSVKTESGGAVSPQPGTVTVEAYEMKLKKHRRKKFEKKFFPYGL
jgi:hypothetical protein